MDILFGIIDNIVRVISLTWWLFLPVLLFFIFWDLWLIYIRTRYIKSIEWVMLEVRVPKDIQKTPKAMEQVFTELAAIYSFGMGSLNIYWEGRVEPWISFEIAGYAGGVHFYIRTPKKYRNLIESSIYAQYPDAEIYEVDDYTNLLPSNLPNKIYDLLGVGLTLAKESYYPIRTYSYFEESEKEKRLDPIAAIIEVMSNLKEGEAIWFQLLISPTGAATGNDWQEEGRQKINEISGRKTEVAKKGVGATLLDWLRNIFWAPIEHPTWPGAPKKEEALTTIKFLTPIEQEVVKAISNKISKFGFEALIRFIYIDKKDSFTSANFAAVFGAIQQFNIQNLNLFKPAPGTATAKTGWLAHFFPLYKNLVEYSKKRKIYDFYRTRRFGEHNKIRQEKFMILNTEELASIYHFPAIMVKAPRLRKLETKKGSPPAGLPTE